MDTAGSTKKTDTAWWTKKMNTAGSKKKMDTADSDDKEEEKVYSESDDTNDDTSEPPDSKRVSSTPKVDSPSNFDFLLATGDTKTCCLRETDVSRPKIKKFALKAVAQYNNQKGCDKMVLEKINKAYSRYVARLEYHINFDAGLIDKEGKKIKQTSYQAVVSQKFTGPITVWFLREGGKDKWCTLRNCLCVFPPWQRPSTEQLLKSNYPEWCLSPDNERKRKMRK